MAAFMKEHLALGETESTSANFPVKTKQTSVVINGEKTEVLCSHYEDRLFVIVTQYNKIGTLVDVTRDVVLEDEMTSKPALASKVLLGQDEPLTHVIAKNLVSKIDTIKPILLSMALKDKSSNSVLSLADVVRTVAMDTGK